jgi:NAD(P)-dependent dehydrogenase (short-subunit alcohol dehydrogenase family)
MALSKDWVWFVTGSSSGFGRLFVEKALDEGWRVAATARSPSALNDLAARYGDKLLPLALDLTDPATIEAAINAAHEKFGSVDVLVNNAGYGYLAAIEEGEEPEIRTLFDVNVFGLAATIRAALPGMRTRKRGWIVNVTSIGGLVGNPGSGYYAASKFAVEGLSEALAKEVEPHGIGVLVVEPGPSRTPWARAVQQSQEHPAYADTSGARRRLIIELDGKQPGDPARGVDLVVAALQSENPPQRLVLGRMAVAATKAKLAQVLDDVTAWEERSAATDFAIAQP